MNGNLPAPKILFVDDEQALMVLGDDLLTDEGYEVVCASSGRQALDLFEQHEHQFDLVVTDESMPGMTGIELAQRLFVLAPQLPVVLCSGFLLSMEDEGVAQTNIKAVLAKTDVFLKLPQQIKTLLTTSPS
ncbi:MAG: response regulator [Pelovirga sp.]